MSTPRILLNVSPDRPRRVFLPEDLDRLAGLGELVSFDPATGDRAAFLDEVRRADAVVTCWGSAPFSVEDWEDREKPLLVAHAAGSIRGLVPRELLRRGLRLTQSSGAMATAVAQWTVGLMILALRQAMVRNAQLRIGDRAANLEVYRDLGGLTVGLVGLSQVGRRVPPLLAPFGCEVLAYDPYWSPEDAARLGVTLVPDLDDLIPRVDALSLHAPVTDETRHLLDARRIGLLKPGGVVVNTARSALVDQDALFARALSGDLEVYVDVTTPEPLPPDHVAWSCPHIFITPHIAGPTRQTLRRCVHHAIDEVERFLRGDPIQSEVTYERYELLA